MAANTLNLASQAMARGDFRNALTQAKAALRNNPADANALWIAAVASFQMGMHAQARLAVLPLLDRLGDDGANLSQPLTLLGLSCLQLGDIPQAVDAFTRLSEAQPDSALAFSVLARLSYAQADRDAAHAYGVRFMQRLKTLSRADLESPGFELGKTLYDCALIARDEEAPAWLESIESLLRNVPQVDQAADMGFHFARALLSEKSGDYAAALDYYGRGNAAQRQLSNYSLAADLEVIENSIATYRADYFSADRCAERRADGPVPIFIMGMPRSGSSLTEQILAAHSQVVACGERDWFHESLRDALTEWRDKHGSVPKPGAYDRAFFSSIRDHYLSRAALPEGTRYLTDKMPANIYKAGLIACAFPEAVLLMTSRDKFPTVMSCFTTAFAEGQGFTETLSDCAAMYDATERLACHWREVLPGNVRRVVYESLVARPEGEIRQLLADCELPDEPACYSPEQLDRPVGTSSSLQVTRPIYRDAGDRWKPFRELLGDAAALFDDG